MKINRDFKAYIALVVLLLGLLCTILAISTNSWFEIKQETTKQAMFSMEVKVSFGLWNLCTSANILSKSMSKCLKVTASLEEIEKFAMSGFESVNSNDMDTSDTDWSQFEPKDINNEIPNENGDIDPNPFQGFGGDGTNSDNNYDSPPDGMKDFDYGDMGVSTDDDDNFRNPLYPDYLKAIQAFEILALITGVATIVVWLVYVFASAIQRKGVASNVFKLAAVALTVVTAVFHLISIITWVVEKEKEKSDAESALGSLISAGPELDVKLSYGWSWGMAIAATILHLLVIVPVALTKPNNPDDGMELSLTP